jgi:hypothetical protein
MTITTHHPLTHTTRLPYPWSAFTPIPPDLYPTPRGALSQPARASVVDRRIGEWVAGEIAAMEGVARGMLWD